MKKSARSHWRGAWSAFAAGVAAMGLAAQADFQYGTNSVEVAVSGAGTAVINLNGYNLTVYGNEAERP